MKVRSAYGLQAERTNEKEQYEEAGKNAEQIEADDDLHQCASFGGRSWLRFSNQTKNTTRRGEGDASELEEQNHGGASMVIIPQTM